MMTLRARKSIGPENTSDVLEVPHDPALCVCVSVSLCLVKTCTQPPAQALRQHHRDASVSGPYIAAARGSDDSVTREMAPRKAPIAKVRISDSKRSDVIEIRQSEWAAVNRITSDPMLRETGTTPSYVIVRPLPGLTNGHLRSVRLAGVLDICKTTNFFSKRSGQFRAMLGPLSPAARLPPRRIGERIESSFPLVIPDSKSERQVGR